MKPKKKITLFWLGILGLTLLAASCRSATPVAFYTLNARTDLQAPINNNLKSDNLSVGIGSVDLPGYLDRPQIVTFKGSNRLHLSEFHRWAGRLDEEIGRVMGRTIATMLGITNVVIFPWDQSEYPDFKVDLNFYHFEGVLGESFRIQGVWTLTQKADNRKISSYQFDQKIQIPGPTYEDLAAACGRTLEELGRKISLRIEKYRDDVHP